MTAWQKAEMATIALALAIPAAEEALSDIETMSPASQADLVGPLEAAVEQLNTVGRTLLGRYDLNWRDYR